MRKLDMVNTVEDTPLFSISLNEAENMLILRIRYGYVHTIIENVITKERHDYRKRKFHTMWGKYYIRWNNKYFDITDKINEIPSIYQ